MNTVLERSVSLEYAETAIDEYFQNHNIVVEIQKYGSVLSSTVATMTFPGTNNESCVGCGKGYDDEARVGAKYEAYEHHQGLVALRRHCKLFSFNEIISQPEVCELLPVRLLSESKPTSISALKFPASFGNGHSLIWPAFMIDYNYQKNKIAGDDADYSSARRYSCGTGFAAGLGFTEAAIHAVSEVIERHCVGVWLARSFFYDFDADLKYIKPETMPHSLRTMHKEAELLLGNKIQLIDITLGNLPPVYIACCRDKTISEIQVFGAGCSYYASHAANRAIKELVQQHAIEDGVDFVKKEWQKHKQHLQKHPRLLKCLIADISSKNMIPWDFKNDNPAIQLEDHLRYLLNACDEMNLPVWIKEIDSNPSGVAIACAVMPGMERFSIVSLGNYVVPTCEYGR